MSRTRHSPWTVYRLELLERLWDYRHANYAGKDQLFDRLRRKEKNRPPVFWPRYEAHNILLAEEDLPATHAALAALQRKPHRFLGSMMSSQALALSVFGNLKHYDKLSLLAELRDEDGLPVFAEGLNRHRCAVEFEHAITYLGERQPTSVDVWFDCGYRVAVECKLTEVEITPCSRPALAQRASNYATEYCNGTYSLQRGRGHRCSLAENGARYWEYIPHLFDWNTDTDLCPCPLFATYQLIRNILAACVLPDGRLAAGEGHAVLLYDQRNPAFREGGKGYAAWKAVRDGLKDPSRLRRATWQQVVACIRQERSLDWLGERLRLKYGL